VSQPAACGAQLTAGGGRALGKVLGLGL